MDDVILRQKLIELINEVTGLKPEDQVKLENLAMMKDMRHHAERAKNGKASIQDLFDWLRLCIKYQAFDLVMTQNDYEDMKYLLYQKENEQEGG